MAYLDVYDIGEADDDIDLIPEVLDDDDDDDGEEFLESDAFADIGEDVAEDWEDGDTEEWEDEDSLTERRRRRRRGRYPRYRRRYRGRRRTSFRRPRRPRFSRTRRVRGGVVRGRRGGRSRVRFSKPVASATSLDTFKKEVRKAISAAQDDYRKRFLAVDKRLDKNTATLDKKINAVDGRITKTRKDIKKAQSQAQMNSLLPMLLTKSPEVKTIRFSADPVADKDLAAKVEFEKSDDLLLPLLLLSGGLGGQGGGTSNAAVLAIALSR